MILETERLLLRELTQEDLPAVCDTLQNDEVRRVYEHDFTDEEAGAWIDRQRARYERYGFGLWAAQLRGGETIGMAGLTLQPCEDEGGARDRLPAAARVPRTGLCAGGCRGLPAVCVSSARRTARTASSSGTTCRRGGWRRASA